MNKKRLSRIIFFISLMLFMYYERQLKLITGVNNILDMMLYYDLSVIEEFMLQLGSKGKEMYLILHKFDYLFILSFGFMQFELIKDKLQNLKINIERGNYLFFIPIFTRGITDVLENILLDITVIDFFNNHQILAKLAYTMTFLKWISLTLIITELIYLILKEKNISILDNLKKLEAMN